MAATSVADYVSVATVESTLSSSTTYLYWGSKVWTLFLSIRESSWEIFLVCFDYLVQLVFYCVLN